VFSVVSGVVTFRVIRDPVAFRAARMTPALPPSAVPGGRVVSAEVMLRGAGVNLS